MCIIPAPQKNTAPARAVPCSIQSAIPLFTSNASISPITNPQTQSISDTLTIESNADNSHTYSAEKTFSHTQPNCLSSKDQIQHAWGELKKMKSEDRSKLTSTSRTVTPPMVATPLFFFLLGTSTREMAAKEGKKNVGQPVVDSVLRGRREQKKMALVAFGSQSGFSVRAGRASLSLSRFSLTLIRKSRDYRVWLGELPIREILVLSSSTMGETRSRSMLSEIDSSWSIMTLMN